MGDLRAVLLLIVLACLQAYAAGEPITVISDLKLKQEWVQEFLDWIQEGLPASKSFAGNLQFDV